MLRRAAALALALSFVACREAPISPAPLGAPSAPSRTVSDGAHGGNRHFYFLPPLAAVASYAGAFDATLSPVVEICALHAGACVGAPIARFTTTDAGSDAVRADASAQQYMVNWHTKSFTLDHSLLYRITTKVLKTELGHIDVRIADNASVAANGADVVLVNGQTLPIKFRVEKGAVYVVTPPKPGDPPATITSSDGAVAMQIPAGALSEPIAITIDKSSSPNGVPSAYLASGSVYEFGPSGTQFNVPVNVTIKYDPHAIPAGRDEQSLRVVNLNGDRWVPVRGGGVNTNTHAATAPVMHFSSYAISSMHQLALAVWNSASSSPDRHEIWLAYEDGSNMTKLADGTHPSWSPDGQRLAYVMPYGTCTTGAFDPNGSCGFGGPIGVVSISNPSVVTVLPQTEGAGKAGDPLAWSPDGSKIAYDVDCRDFIANTDGQSAPLYLFAYACGADWTSDATHLLITGWGPGGPPTVGYYVPTDGSGNASILYGLPNGATDWWFAPGTSDATSFIIAYIPPNPVWEDGAPYTVGGYRPGHWAPWGIGRFDKASGQFTSLFAGMQWYDADVNIPWANGSPGNTDGRSEFDFYPWVSLTPDRSKLYFYASQGPGINAPGIWTVEPDGSHLTQVIDAAAALSAAGLAPGSYIQSITSWRR
jgi:hypothetical protein